MSAFRLGFKGQSWSATDRAGRLPANLAPVSHLDHDDHQLTVLNLVDDPVISLSRLELIGHDSEQMSVGYTHVGREAMENAANAFPEL